MNLKQADAAPSPTHYRVHSNLRVAETIARGFAGRGGEEEDLRQVAYLGLIKASHRYDPNRGQGFLTYAVPTITGEIKRHLRDSGYVVRPPRRLQELRNRVFHARDHLEQSRQSTPSNRELAEFFGVDVKDVVAAVGLSPWPAPLTTVPGETAPGAGELEFDRLEIGICLARALGELPERLRRIICLRFFHDLTQQEIAREIGVSQVHVSRLIAASLVRLRAELEVVPR